MKTRKSAGEIVSPLSKPLSLQSLRLQTLTSAALLATLLVISGCAGTSRQIAGVIKPYRIDVVQGNFVSREQAAAVKVGMTGAQVQQILGTPLLIDPFHLNRWDYVFYIQPGNGIAEQRRHTVLFDKAGKVSSTEGDALPSEDEFVAQLDNLRRGIKTDPAAASAPAVAAAPVVAAPAVVVAAPVAVPSPAPAVVVPVPAAAVVVPAPAPARLPPPPPPVAPPPPPPVAPPAPVVRAPVAPPPVIAPPVTAPALVVVAPPVVAPPEVKAAPAPMPAPVPAPVAVAAPAPAPVVAAAPPAPAAQASASELDREVLTALNAWRLAWAGRNVSAYFAAYTADFKGDSQTRAEWQKQRAERIASARGLRVEVTDVRVRAIDATRLQVAFTQSYRSEELTQVGEKSLFFVKQGGRWLIEREVFFAK